MKRLIDRFYLRKNPITFFCLISYLVIAFIYSGVHCFSDISDIFGFIYALSAGVSYLFLLLDNKIELRKLISVSFVIQSFASIMRIFSLASDSLRMSNAILMIEIVCLPFLVISSVLFLTKRYDLSFKLLIIHFSIKVIEFIAIAFQTVSSVSSFTEFLVFILMALILILIAVLFGLPLLLNVRFLYLDE
jgi:hypothetical protein